MAATVSFGRPYASRICSIFPLCLESKTFVKSTNNIVDCRFFVRTPSKILQIVNICDVVDLFLQTADVNGWKGDLLELRKNEV